MKKITENNWLKLTVGYLQELHNDFENLDEHEKADELEKLIDYLNKTKVKKCPCGCHQSTRVCKACLNNIYKTHDKIQYCGKTKSQTKLLYRANTKEILCLCN